jgi:hypothetical protein
MIMAAAVATAAAASEAATTEKYKQHFITNSVIGLWLDMYSTLLMRDGEPWMEPFSFFISFYCHLGCAEHDDAKMSNEHRVNGKKW